MAPDLFSVVTDLVQWLAILLLGVVVGVHELTRGYRGKRYTKKDLHQILDEFDYHQIMKQEKLDGNDNKTPPTLGSES